VQKRKQGLQKVLTYFSINFPAYSRQDCQGIKHCKAITKLIPEKYWVDPPHNTWVEWKKDVMHTHMGTSNKMHVNCLCPLGVEGDIIYHNNEISLKCFHGNVVLAVTT
jgi:hypothetical protein